MIDSDIFSQADARLAKQKAEEIERLKIEKKREREAKRLTKERSEKLAFRAKFVAPILLIISVLVSWLIWQS